ncbi:methyltransferase domain-containing protein [Staphylococcus nepalensis]|nr:methyltransferase domain-containing protein [Staphylococcus nepalensis]MBO1237262.1 methyltransferase domain-containing protein [Staphylococcus nepalensis]
MIEREYNLKNINNYENKKDYWNPELYDNNHSFVSDYGSSLIELLKPDSNETILDLGCGTGDLANQIYKHTPNVVGIDKSYQMINQARKKYPCIPFAVKDITHFDSLQSFDAVFSNATIHWIKQPEKALENIYKYLKPGGRFVAEFGGKRNVQTITNEFIHQLQEKNINYNHEQFPWYFPSIGEYTSLMENTGFTVTFAEYFDRPTPLVGEQGLNNWINMFSNKMFENLKEDTKRMIIKSTEDKLKPKLYDGKQWIADYKRIRVMGVK